MPQFTNAPARALKLQGVWRLMALALLLAGGLLGKTLAATGPLPSEVGVKAAFLYKFLGFVDWPATVLSAADAPLVVGVIGDDGVGAELQAIVAGRRVNGRPVIARQLSPGDEMDGLHAVFLGRGVQARVLDRLRGRAILVVAEGGLEPGVMLNFVPVAGRVRFEAAPLAAERVGLKLGARLLSVAERVVQP